MLYFLADWAKCTHTPRLHLGPPSTCHLLRLPLQPRPSHSCLRAQKPSSLPEWPCARSLPTPWLGPQPCCTPTVPLGSDLSIFLLGLRQPHTRLRFWAHLCPYRSWPHWVTFRSCISKTGPLLMGHPEALRDSRGSPRPPEPSVTESTPQVVLCQLTAPFF